MSLIDSLTSGATLVESLANIDEAQAAQLRTELEGADLTIEHLQESIADLELMLEDRGWVRMGMWADHEFTRAGLERSARMCRAMILANPLIRRAMSLRTAYVWGGGVVISAKAQGGEAGEQNVNALIQDFMDDRAVRKELTGAGARETNERTLGSDGNLFCALFTAPRTGRVQPRMIPLEEITAIIKNPEDRSEIWFYKRVSVDGAGRVTTTYHPDVDYQPAVRVKTFGSYNDGDSTFLATIGGATIDPGEVLWDAPILSGKVNALANWDFGIGDMFAAIAWARAYKEFLEDWAKLVKALSRFAWRVTAPRKGAAQNAAQRIAAQTTASTSPRDRLADDGPVGQTASMTGAMLEAIPKTGATIDSASGKPLAAMVASGTDVPVTMLLADPGVTGARATAETLDTPTELMAGLRRDWWTEFHERLFDYVIDAAVKAPQGPLTGTIARDEWGRTVVTLDGDTSRSIEISWPDLTDTPIDLMMKAIQAADDIDKLPPLVIAKLVLAAFQVSDADEIIADLTDENGGFKDPRTTAGQVAVDKFNAGEDPAAAV